MFKNMMKSSQRRDIEQAWVIFGTVLIKKYKVQRLAASSTGHYCNGGRISRSIGMDSVQ